VLTFKDKIMIFGIYYKLYFIRILLKINQGYMY